MSSTQVNTSPPAGPPLSMAKTSPSGNNTNFSSNAKEQVVTPPTGPQISMTQVSYPMYTTVPMTMMAPSQTPIYQQMSMQGTMAGQPLPTLPPSQTGFSAGPLNDSREELDSTVDETESVDSNGSRKDSASPRGRGSSRGVSLTALVQEKILDPGQDVLTIDYLGQKYVGDLLATGKIAWKGMQFASPSSWAIYVKKQVNPSKKSGCGWNSVKYKGKKLDVFKSLYCKKHQSQSTATTPGQSPQTIAEEESNQSVVSSNTGNSSSSALILDNRVVRERLSIKHSQLKDISGEIDPNTLVEYVQFDQASGKQQPFNVTISSNCLLLMDFHCHLTTGEVVGYLGGKWDQENQCLNILQAFPCKCRLGDRENAAVSEEQIQLGMHRKGLSKVGWYHSHPTCQAEPTLRDIDCQMQYQMKFSTSNPVLALICSPFETLDASHTESVMNAFWVAPPTEPSVSPNACYGVPMKFAYVEVQDTVISQDLLQELNWLTDFYKLAPDLINFTKVWKGNMTYLEKLKLSVCGKLPKDRNSGNIIQFIQKLLSS